MFPICPAAESAQSAMASSWRYWCALLTMLSLLVCYARRSNIDHEIKWVIENWIRQEPGSSRFIAIDENIIDARKPFGRNPTEPLATFSSGTKYLEHSVVWYISRNHG